MPGRFSNCILAECYYKRAYCFITRSTPRFLHCILAQLGVVLQERNILKLSVRKTKSKQANACENNPSEQVLHNSVIQCVTVVIL